jgi:hypothetical protein
MDYKSKYLKYKRKYLNLKNIQQIGGVRPSPTKSATKLKIGTKKKGNDGNMWVIVKNKNGVKRWKLYKKKKSRKKTIKLPKIKTEDEFARASLQYALDHIDDDPNGRYQWIRNDPYTIQQAKDWGLRIPKSLLDLL